MLDFTITLENENLLLRPLHHDDLMELLPLTGDPNMWMFFTHNLSTYEGILKWAEPALENKRLQFVVVDKSNGLLIGSSALGNYSERDFRIEIGWTWLGVAFQGLGINNQVKQLLLTYCFDKLALERVEFKTDVLNTQARKALSNIWAIEEGVLRSHTVMSKGRRRDTLYYSILKNEWPHVKRENGWD